MKIIINEHEGSIQTEVIINCKHADEQTLKIVSALRALDKRLSGHKDGKTYIIEPADVLYFDTVDKRTFIYTAQHVYETDWKLYELIERRFAQDFFRSSKSAIINIAQIRSIVPDFGGRLEVTLANGEKLIVSRQYAHELKMKIGL